MQSNSIHSSLCSENLIAWYKTNHRKLPWRTTKNPYLIWVSEVMLQQTQVKKVLEYYQNFIDKFHDIHTLAMADLQHILKCWEGMGYYARARNLHLAAQIVVDEMGGEIPIDYENFRKLPGVGDYTAAAVLSQAYNAPYPVIDGNVKRVLSRIFLIDMPINSTAGVKAFKVRANLLLDCQQPGLFNQAMMELGAIICRPQNPRCGECPVSSHCQAFSTNIQQEFPVTNRIKITPEYQIAVGIVYKNNHFLIIQRDTTGLLGGLWEFPGGRVNDGETTAQACIRKIKEKVNLSVEIGSYLTSIKHAYSHFKIVVHVFLCQHQSGNIKLNGPIDYRWITIDQCPIKVIDYQFDAVED